LRRLKALGASQWRRHLYRAAGNANSLTGENRRLGGQERLGNGGCERFEDRKAAQ
jgi:hypothetical protein